MSVDLGARAELYAAIRHKTDMLRIRWLTYEALLTDLATLVDLEGGDPEQRDHDVRALIVAAEALRGRRLA